MSVMLGDRAVTVVWKHLTQVFQNVDMRVFKYEKEEGYIGNYIAINHLPFIHSGPVEEGRININIHVPALRSGLPDSRQLSNLTRIVASLFPDNYMLDGAFYEFYCDSRPTPDKDGTFYVNVKVNVTYNNLN